jgi:hypothetical protein
MASSVTDLHTHPNGLPRQLDEKSLKELIKELLAQGGRVNALQHAYDRMEEREISMRQVLHVLGRGGLVDGPTWCSDHANWKFSMRADTAGQLVQVVAAIDVDLMGQSIRVLTVYQN